MLLGLFAGLALCIAATGIGGVIAYTVSQRTNEIGIRMALGAERGQVIGMVLQQGFWIVLTGLAIGLGITIVASRFMSGLLFPDERDGPSDVRRGHARAPHRRRRRELCPGTPCHEHQPDLGAPKRVNSGLRISV